MKISYLFQCLVLLAALAFMPKGANSQDPFVCNGNNQLEQYPSTVIRCSNMDNPTPACLELCTGCQGLCTNDVENGYFQFVVAGGSTVAKCYCTTLSGSSTLTPTLSTLVIVATLAFAAISM